MSSQFNSLLLSHCFPNIVGPEPVSGLATKPPYQPFSPSLLDNHNSPPPPLSHGMSCLILYHSLHLQKLVSLSIFLPFLQVLKQSYFSFFQRQSILCAPSLPSLWTVAHHPSSPSEPLASCDAIVFLLSIGVGVGWKYGLHVTLMLQLAALIAFPHSLSICYPHFLATFHLRCIQFLFVLTRQGNSSLQCHYGPFLAKVKSLQSPLLLLLLLSPLITFLHW